MSARFKMKTFRNCLLNFQFDFHPRWSGKDIAKSFNLYAILRALINFEFSRLKILQSVRKVKKENFWLLCEFFSTGWKQEDCRKIQENFGKFQQLHYCKFDLTNWIQISIKKSSRSFFNPKCFDPMCLIKRAIRMESFFHRFFLHNFIWRRRESLVRQQASAWIYAKTQSRWLFTQFQLDYKNKKNERKIQLGKKIFIEFSLACGQIDTIA